MEGDRTSTTSPEKNENSNGLEHTIVSLPNASAEGVNDDCDSTSELKNESSKSKEKPTDDRIQESHEKESAISSSCSLPSTMSAQIAEGSKDTTKSKEIIGKKDAVGFKLPGLPLPVKSSVKKLHAPVNIGSAETESKSDELHEVSKTRTNSGEPEDKTTRTSQSDSDDFAFSKPKLANISRQKKDSHPVDSPSLGAVQPSPAALPVNTEIEKKHKEKSPAEKLAKAPLLPYKEPSWSGVPTEEYFLEVLKGGSIISKIPLNDKSYHVFGRLETCDVSLEHPSLSRYHLILQYRLTGDSDHDPGFYLYDLGSTHGSWFNKQQMEGRVFYRMRVGHMLKLGGSTRMYILQGPSEDQEAESELSVKELKELRQQQLAEVEERKRKKQEEDDGGMRQEEEKDAGISWGMDYEDADEVDATGENPYAILTQEEKEATYIKDPKKALRGYFEREGYDLEYNVEEKESGFSKQFVCKVELSIDDASGRPIYAEAAVQGKKKDAVAACALEACRILDAHGVLRRATHESRKKKAKNWKEEDYYDSDEDTFLDRTGEIEKKRMLRMKKAGIIKEKVQTYDSLKSQLSDLEAEIKRIETEMSTGSKGNASAVLEDDSLDAFMASIKSGKTVDKTWRAKLKLRLIDLKKEQTRLIRLVDIARPATMPVLQKPSTTQTGFAALSKKLPMFGSMKGRGSLKTKLKTLMPSVLPQSSFSQRAAGNDEEVEEEEDEQEEMVSPPAAGSSSEPPGKPLGTSRLTPVTESRSAESACAQGSNATESREVTSPLSATRKIGPSIPIEIQKQIGQAEDDDRRESALSSSRREVTPKRMPHKEADGAGMGPSETVKKARMAKGPLKEREVEEKEEQEDFADWMPPVGQTGDGRTHLNAKFGY